MEWLKDYWWVILIFLIGIFINTIKDLNKTSFKEYLKNKHTKSEHHNKSSDNTAPATHKVDDDQSL